MRHLLPILILCLLFSGCVQRTGSDLTLTADFTAYPVEGEEPLTVFFTNLSKDGLTWCYWDFGDGKYSNGLNPTHTYISAGIYTVTLTTERAGKNRTETKAEYIKVTPKIISWDEARKYLGQHKTVEGTVVNAKYAVGSKGKPTFLNLGRPYPDPERFSVVIWGDVRAEFVAEFPPNPETYFLNKKVQVSGLIAEYPKGSGNPQIVLSTPAKIKIIGE